MTIFYIVLIFIACLILIKSADLVIRSLTKIAAILRWSEFSVSFIIVAVATSLPEIFIGITSAAHKIPNLSLGNVVGANIINLTLILGLVAIVGRGLRPSSNTTQKNIFYALVLALFPMLLALDKFISRIDGIIILTAFFFYILLMIERKKQFSKIYNNVSKKDFSKNIFYFIIGVILLIVSAEAVTRTAQILALNLNFPLILSGLLIVSLGTTLPELTFGLRSIMQGHKEMPLGSSLGTIVANSCLALGLAVVIYPIRIIDFNQFLLMFAFLIIASVFFAIFSYTKKEISIYEGAGLIIFYIIFIMIQILYKF